jgi:hypothetical protein
MKKFSNKPLRATTRDAVLVTIVSVAVTLIILWIWYVYSEVAAGDRDYLPILLQSAVISMACQYVYEYSGLNAMIAESSIRYSKGTTLEKYAKSRNAMLWAIYARLKEPTAGARKRLHILQYISDQPYETLRAAKDSEKVPHELSGISADELRLLSAATVEMNEDMIRDMLEHGFDGWDVEAGLLGDTVVRKKMGD